MLKTKARSIVISTALCLGLGGGLAQAQLLDNVKNALGSGPTPAASTAIPGMPALSSVGIENISGVLQYCIKNNYVDNNVAGIKDKLLGQLGGEEQAKANPSYQEGLNCILGGKSGQKMELSGGGLKQQLTTQVCDQVLKYGESLI